ncbi:MAG: hypothetical protein Rubg2KO_04050 [Rubricoccaceae bacterium]
MIRFDPNALDAAARQLGLRLVVGFGSRASRSERAPAPDSDLDLALLAGDRHVSVFDALDTLAPAFPGADLDLVILNGADPLIRFEAMDGGDLLWGDPDLFAEQAAYAYRAFVDSADLRATETALARKTFARLIHA